MRKRYIFVFGVSGSTIFFSALSLKQHDFRKKKLFNLECLFRFSLQFSSKKFIILRRNEGDVIKMYIGIHVKYRLF